MGTLEKAFAKLNLSLDVTGRRSDGYHDTRMVMQTVSLCDDVSVSLRNDGYVRAGTNLRYLPCDDRNIAVKAARAFFAAAELKNTGADIGIRKRIPVCAGMGGGSADGAAVLRALNRLTGKPFSQAELETLGASLGSDIPFCVAGGTVLAEGRGEVLAPLPDFPACFFVIVKPRFSVSTPELFAKLDQFPPKRHPDTDGILSAIRSGKLSAVCRRMYNVFEDILPPKPDDVSLIKGALLDYGALGAVMTGTGSAVFGVFDSREKAEGAHAALSKTYGEVFLSRPQKSLRPDESSLPRRFRSAPSCP